MLLRELKAWRDRVADSGGAIGSSEPVARFSTFK